MLQALLARISPGKPPPAAWFTRADRAPGDAGLSLRYLGTAGFVLEAQGHTIALDPYLSRHNLGALIGGPLRPDLEMLARYVPQADDVFVGHAHYDHALDAPDVCRRTGARLIGSRAVCMVGRAAGLPESQLLETRGREDIQSGCFRVRGLPSVHGKVLMGRVLFPGDLTEPPPWPPRVNQLKHGLVLNWWVHAPGFSLVHVDSADFLRDELQGVQADLVCLCAAGWRARPNYVAEAVELLRPRFVMPCHWDTMLTPADQPARMLPGLQLDRMLDEIRRAGAEPLLLPMHASLRL
jgi:L-ascorbate metabolism protein UlaG (beta-lactamase superfamily)